MSDMPRSKNLRNAMQTMINNSDGRPDGSYDMVEGVGGLSITSTPTPSSAVSAITSIGSGARTNRLGVDASVTAGATISPPVHTSPSQREMMAGHHQSVTGGGWIVII